MKQIQVNIPSEQQQQQQQQQPPESRRRLQIRRRGFLPFGVRNKRRRHHHRLRLRCLGEWNPTLEAPVGSGVSVSLMKASFVAFSRTDCNTELASITESSASIVATVFWQSGINLRIKLEFYTFDAHSASLHSSY